MKSNKGKGLIGLIIALALVGLFGYFGYTTMDDIKLGLDLAGGVSITYQAKEENPSEEDMADTIYKLQQRVQNYSTEAEVYKEGTNRINVDIPGVSDANAILEELGKPGSLIFVDEAGQTILNGNQVATAKPVITDENGIKKYMVDLTFTDDGKTVFADATTKNVGKRIAIIYDGKIYSNPVVNEPITQGQCQISGMTSYEEAETLASTIRIGSLSLELEERRSNVVGAKLGQEAISTSLKAGAIGFGIVAVFMIIVYLVPGLAAVIALSLYVGLILILLSAFSVTLTLPGVAGIILSIGMAVDANVIIFTRIKEEIGLGKTVQSAIKSGFNKALSAIIDGNVTTLIAAGVLFWRGSGTVKGFASTLAIGIVLSMITALFITKFILNALFNLGFQDPKFYGTKTDKKTIDFLGKRRVFFAISIVLCLSGFVFMGINHARGIGAMNYSLEFVGGTSTTVTFDKEYTLDEIDSEMIPDLEDITGDVNIQVQTVQGTNQVIFKSQTLDLNEREDFAQYMEENYGVAATDIATENISSTVSSEMRTDAVVAVVIATICMLLYIWFRFKDIRFATSAVVALVHDVLVVLAFYVIARVSVGNTFIACMLTIVGYSINATIVIFDRIREELKTKSREQSLKDLVNHCIMQTLTRSIYTNLTTFIMVVVLYILGVSSIKEFAAPLMVGIACGTYTSICITGALWYVMKTKLGAQAKEIAASEAKLIEMAGRPAETQEAEKAEAAQTAAAGTSKPKKKKKKRKQ